MALFNLVVQVIDKTSPLSDALDSKHPKAGDVIYSLPATFDLGDQCFLNTHNFWRVLQVDLVFTEIAHLLLPEPGDRVANLLLQYRKNKLDLTAFSAPVRALIASNPKVPINITRLGLLAAIVARPPRAIIIGH